MKHRVWYNAGMLLMKKIKSIQKGGILKKNLIIDS